MVNRQTLKRSFSVQALKRSVSIFQFSAQHDKNNKAVSPSVLKEETFLSVKNDTIFVGPSLIRAKTEIIGSTRTVEEEAVTQKSRKSLEFSLEKQNTQPSSLSELPFINEKSNKPSPNSFDSSPEKDMAVDIQPLNTTSSKFKLLKKRISFDSLYSNNDDYDIDAPNETRRYSDHDIESANSPDRMSFRNRHQLPLEEDNDNFPMEDTATTTKLEDSFALDEVSKILKSMLQEGKSKRLSDTSFMNSELIDSTTQKPIIPHNAIDTLKGRTSTSSISSSSSSISSQVFSETSPEYNMDDNAIYIRNISKDYNNHHHIANKKTANPTSSFTHSLTVQPIGEIMSNASKWLSAKKSQAQLASSFRFKRNPIPTSTTSISNNTSETSSKENNNDVIGKDVDDSKQIRSQLPSNHSYTAHETEKKVDDHSKSSGLSQLEKEPPSTSVVNSTDAAPVTLQQVTGRVKERFDSLILDFSRKAALAQASLTNRIITHTHQQQDSSSFEGVDDKEESTGCIGKRPPSVRTVKMDKDFYEQEYQNQMLDMPSSSATTSIFPSPFGDSFCEDHLDGYSLLSPDESVDKLGISSRQFSSTSVVAVTGSPDRTEVNSLIDDLNVMSIDAELNDQESLTNERNGGPLVEKFESNESSDVEVKNYLKPLAMQEIEGNEDKSIVNETNQPKSRKSSTEFLLQDRFSYIASSQPLPNEERNTILTNIVDSPFYNPKQMTPSMVSLSSSKSPRHSLLHSFTDNNSLPVVCADDHYDVISFIPNLDYFNTVPDLSIENEKIYHVMDLTTVELERKPSLDTNNHKKSSSKPSIFLKSSVSKFSKIFKKQH